MNRFDLNEAEDAGGTPAVRLSLASRRLAGNISKGRRLSRTAGILPAHGPPDSKEEEDAGKDARGPSLNQPLASSSAPSQLRVSCQASRRPAAQSALITRYAPTPSTT